MYDEKIFKEIEKIKWFSKCGKNILFPDKKYMIIDSWTEALNNNFKDKWQEINISENSKIISLLENEKDFDEKYDYYSSFFTDRILPLIQEFTLNHNIDFSIASYIRWVVINSLFENNYRHKYNFSEFYVELLSLYKKGHFPCGWNGNYPDGYLLVY